MLNEDQKFVNELLDRRGLEIKWLAERIHMEPDLLRYQLRTAKNYRQDVHNRIIEVLKKEGYITSNKEVCDRLKDDLIEFSTVLSGTVALITRGVKTRISDRELDDAEKFEIKALLRNQLNRVTDEFNELMVEIDLK